MKRPVSILIAGTLVLILAACSGSTGGLGSVPTAVPTAPDASGGPDLTPAPSGSAGPSGPSGSPGSSASAIPSAAASPSGASISRAHSLLGGEPGSAGL